MKTTETYILDTNGRTHAAAVDACRLILQTLADAVHHYETDVPITQPDWPPDILTAAELLRNVAANTGRVERGGYAQTGLINMAHDDIWSAFVHFAPWAYDATVWDVAGRDIVTLADEAQSIVVRVNLEQYNAIAAVLGDLKLIPQHQHRRDH